MSGARAGVVVARRARRYPARLPGASLGRRIEAPGVEFTAPRHRRGGRSVKG